MLGGDPRVALPLLWVHSSRGRGLLRTKPLAIVLGGTEPPHLADREPQGSRLSSSSPTISRRRRRGGLPTSAPWTWRRGVLAWGLANATRDTVKEFLTAYLDGMVSVSPKTLERYGELAERQIFAVRRFVTSRANRSSHGTPYCSARGLPRLPCAKRMRCLPKPSSASGTPLRSNATSPRLSGQQ